MWILTVFFFTIMREDMLRKQNSTKSQNRPVGEKTVFLPVVSRLKEAIYHLSAKYGGV